MIAELWTKLKSKLTVNPNWSPSIPPSNYRNPSPASQLPYAPPEHSPELSTTHFNYFTRDTRRNNPAPVVVKEILIPLKSVLLTPHTTNQSSLVESNDHLISILSNNDFVSKSTDMTKMDIPVPGKRYRYRLSPNQPPNENNDYFPIYNVQ